MDENMNEEVLEQINEADAEEIPPTQEDFTSQFQSEGSQTTGGYTTTDDSENVAKVLGIISLVTGILSLLCCCITGLNVVLSIAAIVTGIISIKKGESAKGLAIAGIVCGGVGIVMSICMIAFVGLASAADGVIENIEEIL